MLWVREGSKISAAESTIYRSPYHTWRQIQTWEIVPIIYCSLKLTAI